MYYVQTLKFEQCLPFRQALETSEPILAEAVPSQTYWGTGLDENDTLSTSPEYWQGKKMLGKILSKLRDQKFGKPQCAEYDAYIGEFACSTDSSQVENHILQYMEQEEN